MILFFLVLNLLALPMLVTERVIDNKIQEIDLKNLILLRKKSNRALLDRFLVSAWFVTRLLVLFCFLWFFLYVGSSAFIYLVYFAGKTFDGASAATDIPSLPSLRFSFLIPSLWVLMSFVIFLYWAAPVLGFFKRWILPLSFVALFFLFFKIIVMVNDLQGLKILFYPDFKALNPHSLRAASGHALACLFIGFGFYKKFLRLAHEKADIIEVFVRTVIMALLVAMMVGVMALPMIEQVSESPFGSNWVFHILPRWLSYGSFGSYYTGLFFLALSLLCFFAGMVLQIMIFDNSRLIWRARGQPQTRILLGGFFVFVNGLMVFLLQKELQGWSGQSRLLRIDQFVIEWGLPFFALIMVWLVFRYTKRGERFAVFTKQQVMFHNRPFYLVWEKMALFLIPFLIALGWILSLSL